MSILYKILFLSIGIFLISFSSAFAYVSVKGYYRSNGTYVAPYVRSNPNGLKYDNYSYTPSQGLYNSTYGTRGSTWDTPTYVTDPDYYIGKSLYESGLSGSSYSSYTPSYTSSSYTSSYTSPSYTSYTSPSYSSSVSTSNYISNIVGGYKIGDTVICNTNYYQLNDGCQSAPANSNAYGGSTFYCDTGYEKVGSICSKKYSSPSYSSYSYSNSSSVNNSATAVESLGCKDGYSWYLDRCVKRLDNAKYNGSTYSCNDGYYVNQAGNQCVGINTWCQEKHGLATWGDEGKCYCNGGYSLNSVTNKCESSY